MSGNILFEQDGCIESDPDHKQPVQKLLKDLNDEIKEIITTCIAETNSKKIKFSVSYIVACEYDN